MDRVTEENAEAAVRPRVGQPRIGGRTAALAALVAVAAALTLTACASSASPAARSSAAVNSGQGSTYNPSLDAGSPLGGKPAPDFRLTNQFGQPMSLSQFRGKAVILAFNDSQCTNVCPLTTQAMAEAKRLLGPAGNQVQLLGIDANPNATAVSDVMAYSRDHGLVNQWDFLTGSRAQLERVWKAYGIYAQINHGVIDHTPAVLVIDPQGRERSIYLTQMYYAGIDQQAQILARAVSRVLPGHPALTHKQSLALIAGEPPTAHVRLPAVPSGTVTLGPGKPRLLVFFATWLAETYGLRRQMLALNSYASAARGGRLPALTAVDEAATEPSNDAAAAFLKRLGTPLAYPVALDTSGQVADGYGVQDQPWYVLTSASGKILWSHDGWLPVSKLEAAAGKA